MRARILIGLALAVLVAAFSASVRLDAAADTVADLGRAGGAVPDALPALWSVFAAGTAALSLAMLVLAVRWAGRGARALYGFGGAAIACWLGWQVAGIVTVAGAPIGALRTWLFAATVVAAGFALVAAARILPGSALTAWTSGRSVVRIQLLLLVLLFLFVFRFPFVSDQLADVLRAWGDGPWSRAVAGIAAALLLGAVIRTSAARLLLPETGREGEVAATAPNWRRRGPVLALALLAALLLWRWAELESLAIVVALAALSVALSRPAGQQGAQRRGDADRAPLRRFAGVLGVVPVAILVVGLAAAATDSLLLPGGMASETTWLLVTTALTVVLLAVLAARAVAVDTRVLDNPPPRVLWTERGVSASAGLVIGVLFAAVPELAAPAFLAGALVFALRPFDFTNRGGIVLWAAFGTGFGVAVAVYLDPLDGARAIGAFGLVFSALALVLALLHQAASAAARREPVGRIEGWPARVPVVLPLLVWFVVAWTTMPTTLHQARTVDAEDPTGSLLRDELGAWLGDRPRGTTLPMLLVAASGGGAKAAYWSDLVIDCLAGDGAPAERFGDECAGAAPERLDRLFLTSSVSGGSVGVHHLLSRWADARAGRPWVHDVQRQEVLSPPVGWGMFHDLPAFLLGLHLDPSDCASRLGCGIDADRALIQEAAIGASDTPLRGQSGPLAVFNAASGGRRVLLSRASLAPHVDCPGGSGAVDGRDTLANEDVTLGTAAILSARFPGVAPAGRLGTAAPRVPGLCATEQTQAALDLRDGGYIENSGLLTIVDLLPELTSVARARGYDLWPIVVSADDDVPKVTGDDEFRSGPFGSGEPTNRTVRARNRLKRCELDGVSYVRLSPPAHVGAQAATGWEVSTLSRRGDLVAGLAAQEDTLDRVRAALDGDPQALPRC